MKKLVIASLSLGVLGLVGAPFASAADGTTNGVVAYETGGIELKPGDNGDLGPGLPGDLNFGKHQIQYATDETWNATVDGIDSSKLTTGTVNVADNRGSSAGWSVKAKQNAQFANGTDVLASAALSIETGAATNDFGSLPTVGVNTTATLPLGQDTKIFGANQGTGNGNSALELKKFSLAVPKTAEKKPVEYKASITWTLSDAP